MSVEARGLSGVRAFFADLADATATAGAARLSWSSDLPYAFGIETGRTPRGRLARAVGGAFMFRDGGAAALRDLSDDLAGALPRGGQAVVQAYLAVGRRGVTEIRRRTPVRTGRLRASVQMRLDVGHRRVAMEAR
jgi:hypothetical protein